MPRYALRIEYDGSPFSGWQRQADRPSVQGVIEEALSRIAPGAHTIAGAGRTDAGVHAMGQVAHCDLEREWDPFRLSEALNYHLKPAPVAIIAAAMVADDWHARFSAIERRYTFQLIVRRAPLTLASGRFWRVMNTLDLQAMREGAAYLVGRHDFTTFRSSICQADSPVRTLDRCEIFASDAGNGRVFTFDIRARSFLHNQVRSFVGTLERIGAGAWEPADVGTALAARDRSRCGPVCPPHGLYLSHVGYETDPFS